MDDARAVNSTEVNLTQEKIDFINDANQKELQYWKNIALAGKNENERKELTDLAPLRVFLARKDFVKNYATNVKVNELIFHKRIIIYLITKSQFLLLKTLLMKKTVDLSKKYQII